jgi:hypothetical protein
MHRNIAAGNSSVPAAVPVEIHAPTSATSLFEWIPEVTRWAAKASMQASFSHGVRGWRLISLDSPRGGLVGAGHRNPVKRAGPRRLERHRGTADDDRGPEAARWHRPKQTTAPTAISSPAKRIGLRPVEAKNCPEGPLWGGQPIRFLVGARRIVLDMERQPAIGIPL